MSPIKVKYISIGNNPDNLDILVREYDSVDKNQNFNRCPVYRHKKTRTFVAYSPVDFKLGFNNGEMWVTDAYLSEMNGISKDMDAREAYNLAFSDPNEDLVFQLNICNFAFWTNESNVWLDYNCHPLTALKNNFTVIEGWFNLSNWSRNTSLAIRVIDKTKPIIIKKGDPLFRINFLSPDLNRGVVLEKKSALSKFEYNLSKSKNYKEGNKLFSETKKCPFRFLFK